MVKMSKWQAFTGRLSRWILCVALGAALVGLPAQAAPLALTATQTSVSLDAGESLVITGQITNVTGFSLLTTDLFLSISGFAFDAVDITPLLGDPEITIANRTQSSVLDLFQITALADFIGVVSFDVSILLQDSFGNFADAVSVAVTVQGSAAEVAEPGSLALVSLCLLALLAVARGRSAPRASPLLARAAH